MATHERAVMHPEGSQPPADLEAFVQVACEAIVRGLDLGVRRRVGYVRHRRGSVEVVSFTGVVTEFPNSHQPWVTVLSEEDRAAFRTYCSTLVG